MDSIYVLKKKSNYRCSQTLRIRKRMSDIFGVRANHRLIIGGGGSRNHERKTKATKQISQVAFIKEESQRILHTEGQLND